MNWDPVPDSGAQWSWANLSPDGNVLFSTTVDVSGALPPDEQLTAFCRVACIYLITRLSKSGLMDACNSLYDIYVWQQEQIRLLGKAPVHGSISLKSISQVDKTPFVVEAEP